ncbi:MAG: RNA polymerase sigma-70 factor [Bacteroidota bacterium]
MQKHTDIELVELLRSGNRNAFTEIYNRYWNKLFTAAANKLEDFQAAEDIVQQLFITIWDRREVLQINSSLEAYLSVAVKYRVLKALARQFREKHLSDEATEAVLAEIPDNSTQQWLEFEELRARLSILIDALPEKCQTVYRMSRDQGLSQKQIAEKLEVSEKTVEWHISNALKALRSGLKSFFLTL